MDRRQIGLKLVMDGLGLDVRIDDFDDRLILQKAIYLAQAAGVNLGYHYGWYLRGPYSPAVAEDGFAAAVELEDGLNETQGWIIDELTHARLRKLQPLWHDPKSGKGNLARKLELLASVHFLIDREQVPSPVPAEIVRTLQRFNKQFTTEEVTGAMEDMKRHELLK